ncbi:hypothetical protein NBO_64g0060 [Nosema bombycis CQ1]|uniref:Uncharacterized protein n=1 Tax=Nosema bombycis (strain CQ1 / CVCC 102059) TaxID=578461 RepID=R0M6P4_NOSB1|nr:hypothetical protein NBO_64g0060 [Nosema bombycis CQ1]|eukprot:EOB13679.1 hypothetical protein NBO_64g0060 [Nosema bombycis CQ1]
MNKYFFSIQNINFSINKILNLFIMKIFSLSENLNFNLWILSFKSSKDCKRSFEKIFRGDN